MDQPTSADPSTNINDVIDNPGFSNISQKIFWLLDHKTQLSSRSVCKSWKKHIDSPYFWIKKLNSKGQTIDLQNAWIDLLQRIEEGSSLEVEITECLMKFHEEYDRWGVALDGILPIHIASRHGCLKVVQFIVSFSKEPNPPKKDGFTPLHNAAKAGKTEVFMFLAKKVENLNPFDALEWTPLHQAAFEGHIEIFKFLATKLENINLPTHLAAR